MTYDVIVIGTGQAGVPLATKLAADGRRVLIAERGVAGGTCSNTGCTPTKTMIASARAAHVARTAARLGVQVGDGDGDVRVDLAAVVARKDGMVARWRTGVERRLLADRLTLARGHARFVGAREVEIAGARHRAETVVINVGARPATPPLPGLSGVPWLDNRRVMDLTELPPHLLVLGGGYIGCELGQMFRRFGAKVTIVQRGQRLMPKLDEDLTAEIEQVFRHEGIALRLGAQVQEVKLAGREVVLSLVDGGELRGSHLLVATGRRPNTDDLGCDRAGIALDARGFVTVDDRYQTSAPGVFAVGDAIDQPQFTHVAWDDHRLLVELLRGRSQRGRGGRHIPFAVFTDPQIAGVGLTERQALERGLPHEIATMPFGRIARAIELDEPAGIVKVIVDPATERLLGGFIVGAEAGELVHVFVTLMQTGAPVRALVDAQFVHPTFSEGVQSAVMKLARFAL